jgi:two-component system chemotaxis sensor kinase CheA
MSQDISADQMEIIQEFILESREMIEQLEPSIIELGQSTHCTSCWEVQGCTRTDCSRNRQPADWPCWLDTGYLGQGLKTCLFAGSPQDCLACTVFRQSNGDPATMNAIFRLFHSMKGSAGFLDLTHIARVAHAAESLLDLIRSGKVRMHASHVDLLCQACDFAKLALEEIERSYSDQPLALQADEISQRLKQAAESALLAVSDLPKLALAAEPQAPPPLPAAVDTARPAREVISFDPLNSPEMLERFVQEGDELLHSAEQRLLSWCEGHGDADLLAALFRDMHSFKGNCGFLGLADLERLSHKMETLLDFAKLNGDFGNIALAEQLLSKLDVLRGGVSAISQGETGQIPGLDQHLVGLQQQLQPESAPLAASAAPPPQAATEKSPPPSPVAAVSPPRPAAAAAVDVKNGAKRQDIRVDLEKLDVLINLIGEMVIAENMLIHNPDLEGLQLESFGKAAQQMNKLVRELQELAMTIRMVPVSGLFRRMIRLVHDLSMKSGKKVELVLAGEETELDKTVIETITDPLVHLLRNSLDHGLEPPEERLAAGKPAKGIVRLAARHEEGEVWITIDDDGRGLNRAKILAKAASKGLIEGDGSELSDKAVANLIFLPGFSTADQVTDVSGRGVGMDVVKQNVEKIKGKIEVQTRPGQGSTFTLRIPLTLGIIDGMMVRVGASRCIVPTLAIREAFRPQAVQITVTPDGLELARVREKFYPVNRLHNVLGLEPDSFELTDGILILLENQDGGACLFVDEILGQQQTVIKGLSDYIGNVRCVSGCTILGNGEVCLILDVAPLIDAERAEMARAS